MNIKQELDLVRKLLDSIESRANAKIKLEEETMTIQDVCDWLKVQDSYVNKVVKKEVPSYGTGKMRRFKKSELMAWLESKKNPLPIESFRKIRLI